MTFMSEVSSNPVRTLSPYRQIWPLFALIACEAFAFWLLSTTASPQPTPFSVAVAAGVLFTGLLPALLRPSTESMLAACFVTLLASVLVLPFDPEQLPHSLINTGLSRIPSFLILRLVNIVLIGPLALHLVTCFLKQRVLSIRVLLACYGITAVLLVAVLLIPAGLLRLGSIALLFLWTIALVLAAVRQLLITSRDHTPEHVRAAQQARFLLISALLAETPLVLRPFGIWFEYDLSYTIVLAAQLLLPLGVTYAILQHDLFGIDAAVRRALAYATLSLILLVVYFGVTFALTTLLIRITSAFRGLTTVVALFVAAAAFEPLRWRVQSLIDRALYPGRLNFQREISAAHGVLSQVVQRDAVVTLLTQDLPQQLGASWAWLSLTSKPEMPNHCNADDAWNAQLVVGGTVLGHYWLGPRQLGPSYDTGEQAQLQALVQQAALALAYADTFDKLSILNRDLEARVALRTAQVLEQQRALAVFEERQRLARDLHDSVTQTLFSIGLSMRALRGLVQRDVAAATEALREQEVAAQQALAEMRALLAQLRHPLLTDDNFIEALQQHCAALYHQSKLTVTLNLPDTLALPIPQANELLHIAREALHNVVKHSDVTEAELTITQDDETITLEVIDKGKGFDQTAYTLRTDGGFGLRGMQERVAALGGVLEIRSAPGAGTTIRVQIPR